MILLGLKMDSEVTWVTNGYILFVFISEYGYECLKGIDVIFLV